MPNASVMLSSRAGVDRAAAEPTRTGGQIVTTVISVRGRNRDDLLADPAFVYVGREVFRPQHWKASPWGNPFKVGMKRQAAVALIGTDLGNEPRATHLNATLALVFYRVWLAYQPELVEALPGLRGKVLGCWCGNWKPGDPTLLCHAATLARLCNEGKWPEAKS